MRKQSTKYLPVVVLNRNGAFEDISGAHSAVKDVQDRFDIGGSYSSGWDRRVLMFLYFLRDQNDGPILHKAHTDRQLALWSRISRYYYTYSIICISYHMSSLATSNLVNSFIWSISSYKSKSHQVYQNHVISITNHSIHQFHPCPLQIGL